MVCVLSLKTRNASESSIAVSRKAPERAATWSVFGRWLLDEAHAASVWPHEEWVHRWATGLGPAGLDWGQRDWTGASRTGLG